MTDLVERSNSSNVCKDKETSGILRMIRCIANPVIIESNNGHYSKFQKAKQVVSLKLL
jgi:hypothetical protein